MRITFVALHLGIGGAENAIINLSNILSEFNEVEIISTYKLGETPAFEINSNISIRYLTENIIPNKEQLLKAIHNKNILKILKETIISIKILILKRRKTIRAIKEINSDIIISTRTLFNFWVGKYANPKIIKIAQEHNHHNNNKKYIKKEINSLKKIDYFMPSSKELTAFYKEKIRNGVTKCVYIPHSLEYYPETVSNLTNKDIISVGRLVYDKGFLDLIDLFNDIIKAHPDWNLNIVGMGEQYEELNQKIKELNLEKKVFLLAKKSRNELNEIYSRSSIYVMTSYTESFGLVLIEAESFGIPLVAYTSAQGANEIIENGYNGYLIKNRNKAEMKERIINLIENISNRKIIGTNGRKDSKKYKKSEIIIKWKYFLEHISKEKKQWK